MKVRGINICLLFCLFSVVIHAQNDLKIWYDRPASQWIEALPIGNGFIGGMVFGGIEDELIQLNEGTLWSGGPQKKNINPDASQYLKPLREALDKEDYETANSLIMKMQGHYTESFLPLGDLHIRQNFGSEKEITPGHYRRELSLNNAVATTQYFVKDVQYKREVFTSAIDSIMVVRISASKSGMITLDLSLSSQLAGTVSTKENNTIVMRGKAPARVDPNYYNRQGREPILQIDTEGCNGMRVQTVLKAITEGGIMTSNEKALHVKGADTVIILLSAATSFNGFDKCPDSAGKDEILISQRYLDKASRKSFEELRAAHIADFRRYFDRVSFCLVGNTNNPADDELPSDERIKRYSSGNYDPDLEALYFQYGRYLLISSSRPGGSPANLQGIWNKEFRPPWSSNYTININTEMNYWPAETANLSEMHLPLLDWIKNLSQTGKVTAKEYYNARGWVAHHNSDIWGLSNAVGNIGDGDPVWANWQMGGNWLCRHLWEHYSFSRDKEFLKNTAYPVMKEAALFCFDWLIEKDGYLITSPSTSPENDFLINDKRYAVSQAATMDIAIIRDLFTNLIEASQVLDIDKEFRQKLIEKKAMLLPYQIGSLGQLQEWSKDYKEADKHHRHLSHLYGLHPGNQISPLTTPELAKACERTIEIRGDEGTGWSKGWKINFAARLFKGNHAYTLIRDAMNYTDKTKGGVTGGGIYPNFLGAHPPFQIDGNFGATAGIIEMLLQSHMNEIHILPALPDAWAEGEIKGLKARGNFEVDIAWKNNRIEKALIRSNSGNKCILRTSVPVHIDGVVSSQSKIGDYYMNTFDTIQGATYIISAR